MSSPGLSVWAEGPALHTSVRGPSDFCSVFLHPDYFIYSLLMDSFTGKLKILLNA